MFPQNLEGSTATVDVDTNFDPPVLRWRGQDIPVVWRVPPVKSAASLSFAKIIGTVGSKVRLADKSEFVNPASDIGNTPFNVDMDTILDELEILVVDRIKSEFFLDWRKESVAAQLELVSNTVDEVCKEKYRRRRQGREPEIDTVRLSRYPSSPPLSLCLRCVLNSNPPPPPPPPPPSGTLACRGR
jgi:hypothetical protein